MLQRVGGDHRHRLVRVVALAEFERFNVRIRRSIAVAVLACFLQGCGSNAADSAAVDATPAQSSAAVRSTGDGAVPATLRSTIATTLKIDESRVVPAATFAKDLGADELSMVELVMAYERVFSIDIHDADADRFKNVQDVIDYLRKHSVLR